MRWAFPDNDCAMRASNESNPNRVTDAEKITFQKYLSKSKFGGLFVKIVKFSCFSSKRALHECVIQRHIIAGGDEAPATDVIAPLKPHAMAAALHVLGHVSDQKP